MYLYAYDYKTEPFRLDRLKRVSKILFIHDISDKVLSIRDHKGALLVWWYNEPDEGDKRKVEAAWELENELAENVIHKVYAKGEDDQF